MASLSSQEGRNSVFPIREMLLYWQSPTLGRLESILKKFVLSISRIIPCSSGLLHVKRARCAGSIEAIPIWLRGSQLSCANSSAHAELFATEIPSGTSDRVEDGRSGKSGGSGCSVGDTARATMLNALMGGQALTATELAYCANVSRSTASGHLTKLVAARLLTITRSRRFSYYRIASPLVATMLESIKVVAAIEVPPRRQPRSANDDALRFARSCYDHLAGQVGVAVADALVAMGHIVLTDEGGEVTSSGGRFLSAVFRR